VESNLRQEARYVLESVFPDVPHMANAVKLLIFTVNRATKRK